MRCLANILGLVILLSLYSILSLSDGINSLKPFSNSSNSPSLPGSLKLSFTS